MIISSDFKPAWWLRNSHAQTIWSSFFRRASKPVTVRERLELPDGDFVDLDFSPGTSRALICLFHGLEGSIDSIYIRSTMAALGRCGYRCVLMHFRGCSGEPNRKIHSYHSGHTADIDYLLTVLKQREPDVELAAIGFSLGANALLKYQGEQSKNSPLRFAIAISPPFMLAAGAKRMDKGLSKIYQRHLIKALKASVRKKMDEIDSYPIELAQLNALENFWQFDNEITARLNGFSSADDYYKQSSCRQYLKSISKPTHIIHAMDDPFFDVNMIPTQKQLSDFVLLELSQRGGHVGFVSGVVPGKPVYWLDNRICTLMRKNIPPNSVGEG